MLFEELDEYDNRILSAISENARMSLSDIGALVGLSRVSVKKRMDILEQKGIIKGYHTIIDSKKAENGTTFFLDLCTTPDYYEEICEFLSSSKWIRKIYGISGECSIHAEGYTSISANMEYLANSLYRTAKRGIRQMKFSTVLSVIKDTDGGISYERYQEHEHLEETDARSKIK